MEGTVPALTEQTLANAMSHLAEDEGRHKRWTKITEGVNGRKRTRMDRQWIGENGLDDLMRRKVEVLCDNTAKWTQSRDAAKIGVQPWSPEIMENAVTTSNISAFTTIAFPLIRRVYPNLISNFLVAIQPIPLPTALLFYLDFTYGTSFAPVARGNYISDRTLSGSPPYSAMEFARNYASGVVTGEAVATGDASTTTFYLAYFPIVSASLTVFVSGVAATISSVDVETGKVVLSSAPASGAAVTANYSLVFEGTGPIPGIELNMSSDTVTAQTYKLKTQYSIESAQDAAAYHGLDIDNELLNLMAEEITREIDAQIITTLFAAATGANSNSRTDTGASNAGAGNVNWSQSVASGYSPLEWSRTFLDSFLDASQLIHALRLRYANWIVCPDDVIVRMQKLAGWNPNIGVTPGGGVAGTHDFFNTPVVNGQGPAFVGTLSSRFAVLHDPVHLTAGTALLGYRGQSMLDTGFIYAPYQPLYITPILVDPNDMTPRRGVMTRAAMKLITGNFYSTVTITT